ncbi:PLP-dependent aminotransferase family protein [Pelagibacterium montanilacus]|uniref:MocR-like pyridoxine biosynthesis transcription factor PdxR n=1 Tax=Pelagibacterium montanilacus TaxID=2185280 RepID=UPI0013E0C677|nr:PLP-dependent aminotransferase family protein [Pelagibacterium montanilacus]
MLEGLIALDAETGPLPERIYRALAGAVRTGRIKPGAMLPSSRRLAAHLVVSRNSVNAAYELLRADGIIRVRRGAAPVVVADVRLERPEIAPAIRTPGLSTRGEVMAVNLRSASGLRHAGRLEPGAPDEALFPADLWARTLRRVARRRYGAAAIYGEVEGLAALKTALSGYLERLRGVKASPHQILVVPSTQSALSLVAHCLADPGDRALVESPGYFGARTAFHGAGLSVGAMAVDGEGADPASIAGEPAPRLIYVTPSHHYPTGARMTLQRRLDLLDYARRSGAVIIEDDYDSEFLWQGRAIAALQGISQGSEVIYTGTTAKSLLPGLRLAYMVVPEALVAPMAQAHRTLGLRANIHAQAALVEVIESGALATQLRRIAQIYEERGRLLVEGLRARIGPAIAVAMPMGGLQTVVRVSQAVDDVALAAALAGDGYETPSLSSYCAGRPERGLVVGFADADARRVARFADRLDAALRLT